MSGRASRGVSGSSVVTRRALLKGAAAGAATVGAAPLISACGGNSKSGGSNGKQTITVVQNGNAASNGPFLNAVKKFEAAHPNIAVTTVFIPEPDWVTYMASLQTRLAGGSKYDAVYLATEAQLALYSKGALQPLDDFIKKDQSIVDEYYADIAPNVRNQFKQHAPSDGKTYFVQHQCNVMGIWYSKKTLAKYGLSAPADDWTWDDLEGYCAKLAKHDVYGAYLTNDMFLGMSPWIYTNGSNILSDDWKTSKVNSPQALEAARFARGLIAGGYAPEPGGTFDQFNAMKNGKIAMFGFPVPAYLNFKSLGGSADYAIAPWPKKVSQGSPVGCGAYGVPKTSQNAEAAWEFIKWIISKQTQTADILAMSAQPMRQSVLESDAYLKVLPEGAKNLSEAMTYATLIPGVDQASAVEDAIQKNWSQIISGNTTPASGLQTMNSAISGLLS